MIARDKCAHLAARHLNAVLGGVQIALHASDIAVQPIDVFAVRLGGEFSLHGCRQVGDFLIDRDGRIFVLLARLDQIRMRNV